MDIKQLVAATEVELEAAQKRQAKADTELKLILDTARQESRPNLTQEESERTDQLFDTIELAKAQEKGIKDKLAKARRIEAEEADYESRKDETVPADLPARQGGQRRTASVHVMSEERTYHKGNDPTGALFLRDVVKGSLWNDAGSSARLNAHMAEERVERAGYVERAGDVATGGMGGLVVPQYLVDMTAPAIANLRPFADSCNGHQLPPDGMSVTIPTITGGTSAAIQASENTAVSDTAMTELDLTLAVKTASGMQTVSRQAIERGTGIGDVVLQDLFKRYATTLDNELINGVTTGLKAKAVVNTYTSATPTAGEHYTNIMGSASKVEKALLAMGKPNLVVMHGRRWYWLQAQLISTWPFIGAGGGGGFGQPVGEANANPYGSPSRGFLPNGFPVCVDNNVVTNLGASTNQDQIYVTCSDECHLWEAPGQPAFIRAEQPLANQLSVMLVVYGYFAYTFARYASSVQALDGTGLIGPAGF